MSPEQFKTYQSSGETTRADGPSESQVLQPRYELLESLAQTANVQTGPAKIAGRIGGLGHAPRVISDPLEIYPGLAETKSALISAIMLLDQANALQNEALLWSEEGNVIAADDSLQKVRALLPELFCCRTVGDGFGAVVNAIHYCFLNAKGATLKPSQIEEVGRALRLIRQKPFLGFEEAVDAVAALEETGLITTPEGMESIADIEADEGVS